MSDKGEENMNFKQTRKKWAGMEYVSLFKELIRLLEPHTYMELGVSKGFTFNQISPLVKRAIAVDINDCRPHIILRENVEIFKMKTDNMALMWRDTIDFLFIDANHKKEQVLKDFNNFTPFVREGTGIIALHDTHPTFPELIDEKYCSNAYEAAWEIRTNTIYADFEVLTIPGPYAGLTLIRKSKRQLSWK
ncbi:MAG TPA: class I SAM-dependent methyltransferase [Bacteroidales bacterium]|nr:class I SAM-dependent methyltransferase [Bacteroidales bacterium]